MNPEDFWSPYEIEITSFDDLYQVIEDVFKKWSSKNKLFAWRGQVDSSWPLYSSLYRRLYWTKGSLPEERELYKKEGDILKEVHRWGLHVSNDVGRLSALNQLAALQHYGAPTRMIDITFNPWIAAWFAVEKKWDSGGNERYKDKDARLFAIDVTNRLINENDRYRGWEDDLKRPWPKPAPKDADEEEKKNYRIWCTKVFAWKPPHFDSRIAAQNGGFIFGGVPMTRGPEGPNQWPKDGTGYWKIDEVRRATSISIRPHRLKSRRGGVVQDAVYSFRIRSDAKEKIRAQLEKNFGYKHSTMYPDFTGFSLFGTPELKTEP